MPIIENTLRTRLAEGKLSLGFSVTFSRTVDVAKLAKEGGYDWIKVDMEHSTMDLDTASQMCIGALMTGMTPIVRVPAHEHHHISRILDGGAQGVIAPHVDTPEEAKRIVAAAKFPPVGKRSMPGPLPQLAYEKLPNAETVKVMNENTLVVIMLETAEAIANADKIAAVEGVDVLHIGSNDLTAELGINGQHGHEKMIHAYKTMTEACAKHGIAAGMGGIYDEENASRYIKMGCRFINAGGDLAFIMSGAKARADFLKSIDRKGA